MLNVSSNNDKMINAKCQMINAKGFTLVEILISVAIFSWLIMGATYLYQNFIDASISQREKAERNTDIGIALTTIDRDIKMAGFGNPVASRVATSTGILTALGGTSTRLFLADGWEVMCDFTDNNEDDGEISDVFYETISRKRESKGGYCATLTVGAETGDPQIRVYTALLDIDENENGTTTDIDLREGGSLILSEEWHRIASIAPFFPPDDTSIITLAEPLTRDFPAGSIVVPAICYYIDQFEGENWLYRNSALVIPNVENLQVDIIGRIIRVNLLISSMTKKGIRKLGTYTARVQMRN